MFVLLTSTQALNDNDDFFTACGNVYAASRDRVEEVIGRGNFKWALLVLLLLLALWYVRRQRLASL